MFKCTLFLLLYSGDNKAVLELIFFLLISLPALFVFDFTLYDINIHNMLNKYFLLIYYMLISNVFHNLSDIHK